MMTMQDFDINRFRVTDEEMATIAAERKAKRSSKATAPPSEKKDARKFVLYPIGEYTRIAATGHHGALVLYGWLLYLDWKAGGGRSPIKLANETVAGVGLTRWTKDSALRKLEELGLVRVQRRPKKSPLVVVL
jgi:hypothetical protein